MVLRSFIRSGALALMLSISPQLSRAEPVTKTVSVTDLQTIVKGLGLDDTGDKKTFVSIPNQGKDSLTILLYPFDDGKSVLVYSNLGDVPKDKIALMPSEKMLEYNYITDHQFYFAVDGDGPSMYLVARLGADAITPQNLRHEIDALMEESETTKGLWTVENWKGAPAPSADADYNALQDQADAAWVKAPLALQNVVFTQDKAAEYGDYTVRPSTDFKTTESVHLYLEPVNYVWKPTTGREVKFGFAADLVVKRKGGDVLIDKKDIVNSTITAHSKFKLSDITLNISLDGFPPGADYEATVTVRDLNSAKVATTTKSFSVTK